MCLAFSVPEYLREVTLCSQICVEVLLFCPVKRAHSANSFVYILKFLFCLKWTFDLFFFLCVVEWMVFFWCGILYRWQVCLYRCMFLRLEKLWRTISASVCALSDRGGITPHCSSGGTAAVGRIAPICTLKFSSTGIIYFCHQTSTFSGHLSITSQPSY